MEGENGLGRAGRTVRGFFERSETSPAVGDPIPEAGRPFAFTFATEGDDDLHGPESPAAEPLERRVRLPLEPPPEADVCEAAPAVVVLVDDIDMRILDQTGEVIRRLPLHPSRDYPPTGTSSRISRHMCPVSPDT